jgi:hypothetical protein
VGIAGTDEKKTIDWPFGFDQWSIIKQLKTLINL